MSGTSRTADRVHGEQAPDYRKFVTNANLSMAIYNRIVKVTLTSTTNSTITLPSVAEASGKYYIELTSVGTGDVTIQDKGDDANFADVHLSAAGDYVLLESIGDRWMLVTSGSTVDEFVLFDDFIQQTIVEADTPWILNSGADAQALDPAINAQAGGVIRLTTGDADGTTANDGSQLVCHLPVTANLGGVSFETRLHINTAITTVSVCAGFTDATGLEEPFTNSADTITSTATDAVCFLYDTDATTDTWWAVAVDTDVDDTGNASTGTAPVADTYQVLRIDISPDGNTCYFYIDGVLKATRNAGGVSPDVALYATVIACATTTTSKTVDIDYIKVKHNR